ncbi:MAG: class I SAM-dependent methyltransferase, partial [Solirubrobacterales bacterium]
AAVESVAWHDVENGSYGQDLTLWRELSAGAGGPILEAGCGTGRVALDLAAHGHHVLGVDIEPVLVAAFCERAETRGLETSAQVGDIRNLEVAGEFALILVPMQMIQLLEGADERRAALESMRGVLSPRGRIAIAIVEGDLDANAPGSELSRPLPDVKEIGDCVYSSLPIELRVDAGRIVISRLRQIVAPDGDLTEERHDLSLAVLDAASFETEADLAGLTPAGRQEISSTEAHVGSCVVLFEAAS